MHRWRGFWEVGVFGFGDGCDRFTNAYSSVSDPYYFVANHGFGLCHNFLVSLILRMTGVGLDLLMQLILVCALL